MNRRASTILFSPLLIALRAAGALAQPLPVFVSAVVEPAPPRATPEELTAAIAAAQDRMFAIAAAVRKEHGDKRDKWPPDAVDAVQTAENAYKLAIARRHYFPPDTHERRPPVDTRLGLDSIVEDLTQYIGKGKFIVPAATRDAAALIVDVLGRRTAETTGVTDARYFIRLRLRPGPALSGERFREVSRPYRWGPDFLTTAFVKPTATAGFWDVEIGPPASFKTAAAVARTVLDSFVKSTALSMAQ